MPSTVLLSGACGSGKSTILTLGYKALDSCWGPTASFDTDSLLMMVDPHWELPYDESRVRLMLDQCALLAESFFAGGLERVLIGGNALHTPAEINPLVERLLEMGDVFHVTLDPSLDEIVRRVRQRGGDKTPEWLAVHVNWMRSLYANWTWRIDNSRLTPIETLYEIARCTEGGLGQLSTPVGQ